MPQCEENKLVSNYYYNHMWHLDKLPFQLPPHIISLIHNIYMPIASTTCDKIYWDLIANGIFSVNSMYKYLININNPSVTNTPTSYKWIWKLQIPPKISFFLWLICHDRLPTAVYLTRLGFTSSATCPQCNVNTETIIHLFQYYANALQLWNVLRLPATTSFLQHHIMIL